MHPAVRGSGVKLQKFGGYALGATALVACPCHLPLTLPLLSALLAGTSLGALLSASPQFVVIGATGYFVVGLLGAIALLGGPATTAGAVPAGAEGLSIDDGCGPQPSTAIAEASAGDAKVTSRG